MSDASPSNNTHPVYPQRTTAAQSRVERMIAWLRANQKAIDAHDKGEVTFHFGGTSLTARVTEAVSVN